MTNLALAAWNEADKETAHYAMIACCGAPRWADAMVERRPFMSTGEVCAKADHVWSTMDEADWLAAFSCHPRIGERKAPHGAAQSAVWSRQEQASVAGAALATLTELQALNLRYEERFRFTFIVCATGKNAEEMLDILRRRVSNDRAEELREAAEQQRQIMQIRLRKWLGQ